MMYCEGPGQTMLCLNSNRLPGCYRDLWNQLGLKLPSSYPWTAAQLPGNRKYSIIRLLHLLNSAILWNWKFTTSKPKDAGILCSLTNSSESCHSHLIRRLCWILNGDLLMLKPFYNRLQFCLSSVTQINKDMIHVQLVKRITLSTSKTIWVRVPATGTISGPVIRTLRFVRLTLINNFW